MAKVNSEGTIPKRGEKPNGPRSGWSNDDSDNEDVFSDARFPAEDEAVSVPENPVTECLYYDMLT